VPVNGRSIIERSLGALRANGVRKVTVVTGYLEEVLRAHIRRADGLDIEFVSNSRYRETNSMFSLLLGLAGAAEPLWVVEADDVFEPALLDFVPAFPLTWVVDRSARHLEGAFVTESGGKAQAVEIVRDVRLVREGMYKSVGILFLDRAVLAALRNWLAMDLLDRRENDYYDLVLGRRLPAPEVGVADIAGKAWYEIDSPEDLQRAEAMVP
jgi:choline kinase